MTDYLVVNLPTSFHHRVAKDQEREGCGGAGEGGGEKTGGGADTNGEHFEWEPPAQGQVRALLGKVRPEAQTALGRRRRLQKLLQGRARQKGEDFHQRQPQERLPQKVHGQICQVERER